MSYGFTINVESNSIAVMRQIEEQLSSMGVKASVETKKVESSFATMAEGVKGIFGSLKGMFLSGLGIAALFEGMEFIKTSKEAFDNLEASAQKINAALTSTKGIAGETAEEMEKIAKAQSGKVLFGRAAIEDAESMLLTFTSVRGEIYERTLPAIEDFATRFKMDLPEAANTLGKALNDPLRGMTRLQRQGVVFSEAQKDVIKKFVETGQVAKAQEVILKELQTEFGGLAEAMTKTDEGKVAMAKKQWGEIKLIIGEVVSKLEVSLIPVLTSVTFVLKAIIALFKDASTSATIFRNALLAIISVMAVYITITKSVAAWTAIVAWYNGLSTTAIILNTLATEGLSAAWTAFTIVLESNPIGWIITLIVALVVAIMYCWDHFKTFREIVGGVFGFFKAEVMSAVHAFVNFARIMDDVFHGRFKKAMEDGKKMVSDFKNDVTKGMIDSVKQSADAFGKSNFKFSNLLKFGGEQSGPSKGFGEAGAGDGVKQNAINTSNLSGASGGLGQAKVINIKIDTMQKVVTSDNKDLKHKGQDAVELMLRTLNNIAYSQGETQ